MKKCIETILVNSYTECKAVESFIFELIKGLWF